MAMKINCKDAGAIDCEFVAKGQTEEEVIQKAAEHGRNMHGMKDISPEIQEKLRLFIRNE